MYYYKQIDRESGQVLALQSSEVELQDNHETIRFESLTEEQYNLALAEMLAYQPEVEEEDEEESE